MRDRSMRRTASLAAVPERVTPVAAAFPGGRPESAIGTLRLVKPGGDQPSPQAALEELEQLLASSDFDGTPRSRAFLRFIMEETLSGRQDGLTQTALATRVFGRRDDFDPTIDPIVRIQAGRLRRSLERYYLLSGTRDAVRIEVPRGGYVPVVKWASGREAGDAPERAWAREPDDWPSVVVGPFRTGGMGGGTDEAELRFCERLAFEIGRYGDVRVVLRSELDRLDAPPSEGGSFALSGHLSGDGGWRAIARLVDGRNAMQIWAEEFRGQGQEGWPDEAARLIAARIASQHGAVARTLSAERRSRPPLEATPYDAVLRSYQFLADRDARHFGAALDALQRVVDAEPECSLAWVQLARLCTENYACELSSVETPIELAVSCALNGTHLDPFGQHARAVLAQALFVQGDVAAACVEARRALDLDPRSFAHLEAIGWLLTLLGDGERGASLVREAMARNPNPASITFQALWADHLRRGEVEESRRAAVQYRDRWSFWPALMRACSLAHLGRLSEAKAETAEVLARKPDFVRRGRTLIGRLIRIPELFERVLQGVDKAGLALS